MQPPLLVYALRLHFFFKYGGHRGLHCPFYGFNKDNVKGWAADVGEITHLRQVISLLNKEARYMFGSREIQAEDEEMLRRDIDAIRVGKGDACIERVQNWIAIVRMRALEDLALMKPESFCNLWESRDPEMWETQSKTLYNFLKMREDVDLGWLPMSSGSATFSMLHFFFIQCCVTCNETLVTLNCVTTRYVTQGRSM